MTEYSRNGDLIKVVEDDDYMGVMLKYQDKDGKEAKTLFECTNKEQLLQAKELAAKNNGRIKITHENGLIKAVGLPSQGGQNFDPLKARKSTIARIYFDVLSKTDITDFSAVKAEIEAKVFEIDTHLSYILDKVK